MSERLAAELPASLPDRMPVRIRAQVSLADPDSCTFVVSHPVHPGSPFFFRQ